MSVYCHWATEYDWVGSWVRTTQSSPALQLTWKGEKALAHVPLPNTARVCLRYDQNGEQTCNIFHVLCPTDPSEADLTEIATIFRDWWDAEMQGLTVSTTSLEAIEVKDMTADGEEGILFTAGLPLAGSDANVPLPNNVTFATRLNTGFTGRSRRGRSYFAGVPADALDTDKQHITSTWQTLVMGAFADLLTALVTAGFELAVASTIEDGVPRTTGLVTPISSVSVNTTLDSQRRRLPERGS